MGLSHPVCGIQCTTLQTKAVWRGDLGDGIQTTAVRTSLNAELSFVGEIGLTSVSC